MFCFALIMMGIYAFQLSKTHAEVIAIFEDFTFPHVDKTYFAEPDSYITDENSIVMNLTVVKRLPEITQSRMNLLGLSKGEYVIPSGIDIEMEFCEMISETFVVGPLLKVFGIKGDECPPGPGSYGSANHFMDTSNFPDTFPRNKYLSIFTIDDGDDNLLTAHIFLDLQ